MNGSAKPNRAKVLFLRPSQIQRRPLHDVETQFAMEAAFAARMLAHDRPRRYRPPSPKRVIGRR